MFSCQFLEISKNIFLHRAPLVGASNIKTSFRNDWSLLTSLEIKQVQYNAQEWFN